MALFLYRDIVQLILQSFSAMKRFTQAISAWAFLEKVFAAVSSVQTHSVNLVIFPLEIIQNDFSTRCGRSNVANTGLCLEDAW